VAARNRTILYIAKATVWCTKASSSFTSAEAHSIAWLYSALSFLVRASFVHLQLLSLGSVRAHHIMACLVAHTDLDF
jgi:hypothetical protein